MTLLSWVFTLGLGGIGSLVIGLSEGFDLNQYNSTVVNIIVGTYTLIYWVINGVAYNKAWWKNMVGYWRYFYEVGAFSAGITSLVYFCVSIAW